MFYPIYIYSIITLGTNCFWNIIISWLSESICVVYLYLKDVRNYYYLNYDIPYT